jgi:hypothetical protein
VIERGEDGEIEVRWKKRKICHSLEVNYSWK